MPFIVGLQAAFRRGAQGPHGCKAAGGLSRNLAEQGFYAGNGERVGRAHAVTRANEF
jgi:hypothetical protein